MANQKLRIDVTTEDAQQLQNGEVFHWTYETDKGESIDIELFNPDLEQVKCDGCGEEIEAQELNEMTDGRKLCNDCEDKQP